MFFDKYYKLNLKVEDYSNKQINKKTQGFSELLSSYNFTTTTTESLATTAAETSNINYALNSILKNYTKLLSNIEKTYYAINFNVDSYIKGRNMITTINSNQSNLKHELTSF